MTKSKSGRYHWEGISKKLNSPSWINLNKKASKIDNFDDQSKMNRTLLNCILQLQEQIDIIQKDIYGR